MTRNVMMMTAAALLAAAVACSTADDVEQVGERPAAAAPDTNVEQAIEALEQEWVTAILAKDAAAIDRLLAADFVGTTNDRRYTKQTAVDDVRDGNHEMIRLDDVQVRVYGDTAVVDVDQTEKSRHGTEDFSGSYMFTDVWIKRDGGWKAVASHGSRIR